MGLNPKSKVFLTETGFKFAMSDKKRVDSKGKEKIYKACDVLMTCLYRIGFRFKPTYQNSKLRMEVQSVNQR